MAISLHRLWLLWVVAFGFSVVAAMPQLDLARLGDIRQSSDDGSVGTAVLAVDGKTNTVSLSAEISNAAWECELRRLYTFTRVEVVTPTNAVFRNAASGLWLRIQDLRDRTVYQKAMVDPGLGGIWSVDLPTGTVGRILQVTLADGQPNGAGKHQVALAEVRVFGDPSPAFGPLTLSAVASVEQSSEPGTSFAATRAVDGDPATLSQTEDLTNSYWLMTLDRPRPIRRVDVVNRRDCCAARLDGLVLRILDEQSNSVASATIKNPGLGAVWSFDAPPGTTGRYVRIGLEGGAANGSGDRAVSLAEVVVLTATNLALGRDSYMVRYQDGLPPATNANDGNYATETKTTEASVDAYWEVDLGRTEALYSVRTVAANGFGQRLSHATVRLFDARHESVFSQHLAGTNPTFDVDVGGPILARYVRVGFENKERSHVSGGIEWYLGLKEVQAFGRAADEVGLLDLTLSTNRIVAGSSATLSWRVADLHRLELHPSVGSMGAHTQADGRGALAVSPTRSVEYWLVGTNRSGTQARAVTLTVDGQRLPVQINEFMADNRVTLMDGRKEPSDWIELHNPNNEPMDLRGYGLSDDPAKPMKWVFPSVTIPAHGYLVVFASGRNDLPDAAGYFHADFQLDPDGESVVLTEPDQVTVADAIRDYPPQRGDLAYGRTLDGKWTFLDPTPGEVNLAPAYEGWLRAPVFSHSRGFYTNSFSLILSHDNSEGDLVYATDGREPSVLYTGPLSVGNTLSVRASVRRSGFKSPRTVTHSYVFVQGVMNASYMNQTLVKNVKYTERIRRGLTDLPTIAVTVPQLPDDYNEREASMELFWPDGAKPLQANCGFFRFGGAWTTFAKKNYRLKFRPEYGTPKLEAPLFRGFDHGILARDGFDEIDLGGGSHDMVERGFYLSSRFTEDTLLEMGSLNPHGRFVNVYINGKYWGQYHARERLVDSFLAEYLGGSTEDYMNVRGNDNVGSDFIPGTPDPLHRAVWEDMRAQRRSYVAVKPWLDVPHLIDFMLMWSYGNSESEYRSAGPIRAGTGFKFWIGDSDGYLRTEALTQDTTGNVGPGGLFGALTTEKHADFMTLMADRIQRHLFGEGALTPDRNLARLNARMLEITNSLVAECARWGFRTPENWESAAQTVRTGLFPKRTANLLSALRSRGYYPSVDAPRLSQAGGTVTNGFNLTFSSSSGTVYYTLDGSDPRLPGGAVAPEAIAASSGGQATLIEAGTTWKYWDQGAPPVGWRSTGFNDQAWPSGKAELGYGDGGEVTVLRYGTDANNKYPTYYFRQAFVLSNPAAITELVVELVRDDGAVVYLNDREVVRDNLPAGTITDTTLATASAGGTDETQFFNFVIPPDGLRSGTNVVAVEVHQSSGSSSDVSFNLALRARTPAVSAGLTLHSNTVVRARVRSGATWSAIVDAPFYLAAIKPLAPGDVVVSEIHYNPHGSDDYEFIELFNRSTNQVDLGGARLSGGVEFLFPAGFTLAPGALVLVVENAAAFAERYQNPDSPYFYAGVNVAGAWSGRLGEQGETIRLLARDGSVACTVEYGAGGSWPQRADGKGSSLELRAPSAVPSDPVAQADYLARPQNWRSSSLYHGSPGRVDDYVRPVVINESFAGGAAGVDWIELHNPGPTDADLSEFCLTDHYDQPFRYRFPSGTKLPAGAYRALGSTLLGFGFDANASDIVLLSTAGTNVIRFVDTVDYADIDPSKTCGRYERSDGQIDYTELRQATPDAENALPRVGPVVFSEILYRPVSGAAEFVELVNVSDRAVLLYDPAHPTNTWTLTGAVRFAFPPGLQLAPCTPLVICSTNPATFRFQHGLNDDVQVLGPWTGSLNNAGESVRLMRPGELKPDGSVEFYRVDRVSYEAIAPWPSLPEAGGVSLARVTLEGYGNDPGNWQMSDGRSTPGRVQANRPPAIRVVDSGGATVGETIELWVQVSDPDWPWQIPTVRAEAIPAGSSFDPATGLLRWPMAGVGTGSSFALRWVATDSSVCPASTVVTHTLQLQTPITLHYELTPGELAPGFYFEAKSSRTYELQGTDTLSPIEWRTLERFEHPKDGRVEFRDPQLPASAERYYRVKVSE